MEIGDIYYELVDHFNNKLTLRYDGSISKDTRKLVTSLKNGRSTVLHVIAKDSSDFIKIRDAIHFIILSNGLKKVMAHDTENALVFFQKKKPSSSSKRKYISLIKKSLKSN